MSSLAARDERQSTQLITWCLAHRLTEVRESTNRIPKVTDAQLLDLWGDDEAIETLHDYLWNANGMICPPSIISTGERQRVCRDNAIQLR